MKLTTAIAAAALTLSMSAQAEPFYEIDAYCDVMAQYANDVAIERNQGLPEKKANASVILTEGDGPNDAAVTSDMLYVVSMVYRYPWLSRFEARETAKIECVQAYREQHQ